MCSPKEVLLDFHVLAQKNGSTQFGSRVSLESVWSAIDTPPSAPREAAVDCDNSSKDSSRPAASHRVPQRAMVHGRTMDLFEDDGPFKGEQKRTSDG